MPDVLSHLDYIIILIEVDLFRLESSDKPFRNLSVLPRTLPYELTKSHDR